MSPLFDKMRRGSWAIGLGLLLLLGAESCRPYRMPNPKGPPQPKVKAGNKDEVSADGRSTAASSEIKPIRNSYDKKGLLKKPKYERRRLKKKVGQRTFLGVPLPF
ncbi:hypothetical protein [Hymenobacter metallicola]|uniref:Uncharacterized protein n=1 Tax=Hymenobacter metallicola TaxID=2563114 RepID=A0A4Z0QFK7_9BACT|nr:hypothetical protein [Hymenobacter metallicola]TGE27482.1 hypothetical protein E5K02_13990 [Hymenobacter metallicola]